MRRGFRKVGGFFKTKSHSSGSSLGRTEDREEGSGRAARTPSPELSSLRGSRPISTVASPTRFDDDGRVTDPGHIQYQASEYERARYPKMSEALGHSRHTGPGSPRAERFPVSGYLQDGRYFNVTGVRGPAINAGDDHVIDRRHASHVIDHGELSDDQAARYIEYQSRPVYPTYETSGYDRSNCVHCHAELGHGMFGWSIQHHQHAAPDQLAEQMRGLSVRDYSYSSHRNGSDSDSE